MPNAGVEPNGCHVDDSKTDVVFDPVDPNMDEVVVGVSVLSAKESVAVELKKGFAGFAGVWPN